jgi:hypothetical protein
MVNGLIVNRSFPQGRCPPQHVYRFSIKPEITRGILSYGMG